MESLGDIIKRLGDTTRTTSAAQREAYASVDPVELGDACDVCGGRGWLTPEVPAGHADFGKVLACRCQQERIVEERTARLVRYSNIGHLSRFTFDTIKIEGLLRDAESREASGRPMQPQSSTPEPRTDGSSCRVRPARARLTWRRPLRTGASRRVSLSSSPTSRTCWTIFEPASDPPARLATLSSSTRSETLSCWCSTSWKPVPAHPGHTRSSGRF